MSDFESNQEKLHKMLSVLQQILIDIKENQEKILAEISNLKKDYMDDWRKCLKS